MSGVSPHEAHEEHEGLNKNYSTHRTIMLERFSQFAQISDGRSFIRLYSTDPKPLFISPATGEMKEGMFRTC